MSAYNDDQAKPGRPDEITSMLESEEIYLKLWGKGGTLRTGENPDDVVDYSETEAELAVPEGEAGLRVLAHELLQCLANVELRAEDLRRAEARLAAVAERRLPDLMQELSILKYTFVDPNDGKTHVIKYVEKIRTSMADLTEEQKAAVFAWLREQGLGGIIKKKVEANIGLVPDAEVIKLIEAIQAVAPECETTIAEKVEPSTLTATVSSLMEKGVNISEFIKVTPVRKATAGKK